MPDSRSPAPEGSPGQNGRSPTPARSPSPERKASESPDRRGRSRTPERGRYSEERGRSRTPEQRGRSRTPEKRNRSRTRSPAPNGNSRGRPAENPGTNLYVTGLSTRVTEEDLERLFSKEGKVSEARIVVDPRTQESRGFGFITMVTAGDADTAIRRIDGTAFEGRRLTVEKVSPKGARFQMSQVSEARIVRDPRTKESRGFGFVTMAYEEDVENVLRNLGDSIFEGRRLTVEKAKRARERTPTPGQYRGVRGPHEAPPRSSRYESDRYDRRDRGSDRYGSSSSRGYDRYDDRYDRRRRSPEYGYSRRERSPYDRDRGYRR